MSRSRCSSPAPAAALEDDDLLQEIFLRLPPQPSSLPRASLVCAQWRSVLADPHFVARFRKRHRNPPLLGFFRRDVGARHVFTPFLGSPDRIPAARFFVPRVSRSYERWDLRGCRHGLAVLVNDRGREAVVWDPLTGQHRRHRVPFPPELCSGSITETSWLWHPAVVCADTGDGHVHGDCFLSPFRLILMCQGQKQASACVYSSASGVWGDIISTATTDSVVSRPGILVGDAVHWLFRGGAVLVFDFERQSLGVIEKPAGVHFACYLFLQLLRTGDDGSLGLAVLSQLSIHLWKRQSNSYGAVEWVLLQKTIQLQWLFPRRTLCNEAIMVGYDEDSNEIVLSTSIGLFMLQIDLMKFRPVCKSYSRPRNRIFYPYRNFYTAGREVGWKWVNLEL